MIRKFCSFILICLLFCAFLTGCNLSGPPQEVEETATIPAVLLPDNREHVIPNDTTYFMFHEDMTCEGKVDLPLVTATINGKYHVNSYEDGRLMIQIDDKRTPQDDEWEIVIPRFYLVLREDGKWIYYGDYFNNLAPGRLFESGGEEKIIPDTVHDGSVDTFMYGKYYGIGVEGMEYEGVDVNLDSVIIKPALSNHTVEFNVSWFRVTGISTIGEQYGNYVFFDDGQGTLGLLEADDSCGLKLALFSTDSIPYMNAGGYLYQLDYEASDFTGDFDAVEDVSEKKILEAIQDNFDRNGVDFYGCQFVVGSPEESLSVNSIIRNEEFKMETVDTHVWGFGEVNDYNCEFDAEITFVLYSDGWRCVSFSSGPLSVYPA